MGLAIRKSRLKKCHVDYRFDYLLPSIIRVYNYYFSLFLCKKNPQDLISCGFSLRNDRENNTIRGFRFLVELSFGIWCSWVQSGCKTRRIWCTHSFRFAVISERTMARGRKKKFSDYIRTEVARIYRLLHNVGTLRRVPIFHFGCIFIGLTFLCP